MIYRKRIARFLLPTLAIFALTAVAALIALSSVAGDVEAQGEAKMISRSACGRTPRVGSLCTGVGMMCPIVSMGRSLRLTRSM